MGGSQLHRGTLADVGEADDAVIERLRLVDFLVLAAVAARPGVSVALIAKGTRHWRWRVRRSLKRLAREGIVERGDGGYQTTQYGKELAPVALTAVTLSEFEGDLRPDLLEQDRRYPSVRWARRLKRL